MDRLRSIFDGMFDGVWLVAANGRTTYANAAMTTLLGCSASHIRGRPITDFLDATLWPEMEGFLARQRTHAGERMEIRFCRSDGTDLFAFLAGSPIVHEGSYVGSMLNVSDVTGKHSIDAQIVQNQRLEAIGEFAGGVAHDFNNLLTAIHGYAELARAGLAADDPIAADLDQVIAGADRATAITRKLVAFTRRQVLLPMDLDPGAVVADLLPILRPLAGDGIVILLQLDAPHSWVRVDSTQLEQVIMNLVVNARDAMSAGGTVTISIRDIARVDPDRPDPDLTAGPFVRISVSDLGSGMDDDTKARIFDPFFTTKGPAKGTGLGLSTVFGIVTQSQGRITVESEVGIGSTFHIDLPLIPARPASPKAAVRSGPNGSGVILLVDDDRAVRTFAQRSLIARGYHVLEAEGGTEALQVSREWHEPIDVLLTDVAMLGLQGPDLAAKIREQRRDIAVILMSGYADQVPGVRHDAHTWGRFLPKPFTIEELCAAVAEALVQKREREPAGSARIEELLASGR